MATVTPPSNNSYQTQQNLAQLVSSDVTSALSTVDTLSSLKLLRELSSSDSIKKADRDSIQACIDSETRYLRTSLHMLQNTPALSRKFGVGLGAALSLSSVLRQKHAEKTYDTVITKALNIASGKTGLMTPEKRAGKLNKTSLLQDSI